MKGPAMLLIRNLSQVLLASCQDRKGMGMLHGNKIENIFYFFYKTLPQRFPGITSATQAVSYRNGELFNQSSSDLMKMVVVAILDFIKMEMITSNSVVGFIRLPFLSL